MYSHILGWFQFSGVFSKVWQIFKDEVSFFSYIVTVNSTSAAEATQIREFLSKALPKSRPQCLQMFHQTFAVEIYKQPLYSVRKLLHQKVKVSELQFLQGLERLYALV